MDTEKKYFFKIDNFKNGTITSNNSYNDSIACEKFVTLSNLNEYDKRIKDYINSKIDRIEKQERSDWSSDYFKRVM